MRPFIRLVLLLFGALTLAITAITAQARPPSGPPPATWIAFVAQDQGLYTLYRYHLPTGRAYRLSRAEPYIGVPAWSPDGAWISYVAITDGRAALFRVDADYTRTEPLSLPQQFVYDAAWSPEGDWIVYTAQADEYTALYRVRSDGTQHAGIALRGEDAAGLQPRQVAWSPDGDWIAFAAWRGAQFAGLYVMRPDGSGVQPVLATSESVGNLTWSPDSQWIAVQGTLDSPQMGIYRVRMDGGGLQRLSPERFAARAPCWSSDGDWIMLMANDSGRWQITRIAARGGEMQRVFDWPGEALDPAYARSGESPYRPAIPAGIGIACLLACVLLGVAFPRRTKPS